MTCRPEASPRLQLNPLAAGMEPDLTDVVPLAIGYQCEHGRRRIDWDNRHRPTFGDAPYLLLQYSISGAGWFRDRDRTRPVPAGHAILAKVPSPTAYGLRSGEEWEWIWIGFRGSAAERIVNRILSRHDPVLPLHDHACARALCAFYDELAAGRCGDAWAQSQRLYDILMTLSRWSQVRRAAESVLPRHLQRCLQRIEADYQDPDCDVSSLARALGVSRTHLARLARRHGISLSERLRERRLQHAHNLLALTDLSVSAVAERAGFRSSAYFCAAFKQRFGLSPGRLRRQA